MNEVNIQRQYYTDTAAKYEALHVHERDEHSLSLAFLDAYIGFANVRSVLDVGSGTGRVVKYLKKRHPDVRVVGVEPVAALREVGFKGGLSTDDLVEGDATKLGYANQEFDLVCEFAVLHHLPDPEKAVREMLRVSRLAIFISDSNNFGQGSLFTRVMKQAINALGAWKAMDWLKTRGRGYNVSEEDGISYSYSVFNNYKSIKNSCRYVHVVNTMDGGVNPYRSAGHVMLLGRKLVEQENSLIRSVSPREA